MLGLPDGVKACLFDLDGVLTKTAKVHAAAWKQMFDDFLRARAEQRGDAFVPFDEVKSQDPRGAETIHGLGTRKNEIVLGMIERDGVETYEGSVEYVRAARHA